jgi:hypothetical protein
MDLQEDMKKSIQTYMDGQDVMPEGRKYTKEYLDNFHAKVTTPDDKKKSDKKVKDALNSDN